MPVSISILAAANASTQPLDVFGIRLIGITPENLRKLLFMAILIVALVVLNFLLRSIARLFMRGQLSQRVVFWVRQGISVLLAVLGLIGVLSIWFDNPARLGTFMGLVTAGVAFALQKPISALAGYIVILRGKTFSVGDRITMGGIRGDVVALGFIQTTIMEMGQPPSVQGADPAMWVRSRQYTGRIVSVSNSTVFDEPVYNYTRDFPYIWDEMMLPIAFGDDRNRAEQILLEVADKHTVQIREMSKEDLAELHRRYFTADADVKPKVYLRITDNWVELSLRFIARTHGVRDLKNAMSREILAKLDEAKIGIASGTYAVVQMPPLKVQVEPGALPAK